MFKPTLENFWEIWSIPSNGEGRLLDADWFATNPSLLPNGTFQVGPPLCKLKQYLTSSTIFNIIYCFTENEKLTKTTESLAAMVNISAHETTPLHWFSTAVFMESITSYPLAELLLASENFSLSVPSNRIDASHPCQEFN